MKIYCCYHDEAQLKIFKHPQFEYFYGPRDPLNPFLSEFSMIRHIMETDTTSNYLGTCHYRRVFDFNLVYQRRLLLDDDHCIVGSIKRPYRIWDAFAFQKFYAGWFKDVDYVYSLIEEYVVDKYGRGSIYLHYDNNVFINRVCAVMNRKRFLECADFCLGFVDFLDTKFNLQKDYSKYLTFVNDLLRDDKQGETRALGCILEWMHNIFMQSIKNKYLIPIKFVIA